MVHVGEERRRDEVALVAEKKEELKANQDVFEFRLNQ